MEGEGEEGQPGMVWFRPVEGPGDEFENVPPPLPANPNAPPPAPRAPPNAPLPPPVRLQGAPPRRVNPPPPPAAPRPGKDALKRTEMVNMLHSMGFLEQHALKAVQRADPNDPQMLDWCLNWLEKNPLSEEESQHLLVKQLMAMGFSLYVTMWRRCFFFAV